MRPYPAGWGYNRVTGPDADSTAMSLKLHDAAGLPRLPEDEAWLLERWLPGGGVATYPGAGAWATAHNDVTAIAFMAFPERERTARIQELTGYLHRTRQPDGTWPSYWWRTAHYATFYTGCLIRDLALAVPLPLLVVDQREGYAVESALDLALVVGIAGLIRHRALGELTKLLLSSQCEDGRWDGGPNLRVTSPTCWQPWRVPRGTLYVDEEGLITTATAIRVLGEIL